MPWGVVSLMSLRQEFVRMSEKKAVSFTELCQRYGISRKSGYKWLGRYRKQGAEVLKAQPRRHKTSPGKWAKAPEQPVLSLRQRPPRGGARKIRLLFKPQGKAMPACSTITALFHRHGLIEPNAQAKPN